MIGTNIHNCCLLNTIKVYRITATRGRVLIINIRDASDREGSQYDFKNLEEMFGKLGFIVSNLSGDKDWTAEIIITINL